MENALLSEAFEMKDQINYHRNFLHANAEVGFDLPKTYAYVHDQLSQMGYNVKPCGKCGLTAAITGKRDGKTMLLRADMDGLPILEESKEPFASTNGNMHACGHDMHTAMLLGAAKLLMNHKDEIQGTVKLMFQSAEEILHGAKDMIDCGVLKNPDVDAAMMIHVATALSIPIGSILIPAPGISAPAADYFTIRVHGKGCHGSAPQDGIDALTAAAHILIGLQEIKARESGIFDQVIMTIGTMKAGSASNVIADNAVMGGTIRTFNEELRSRIKERITQIAVGIGSAFRTEVTVEYDIGCPVLINNANLSEFAEKELPNLLKDKAIPIRKIQSDGKPSAGGSEDFSYIANSVPSLMLSLAAGNQKDGYEYPLHHPKVRFDPAALPYGAATLAFMAISYLKS